MQTGWLDATPSLPFSFSSPQLISPRHASHPTEAEGLNCMLSGPLPVPIDPFSTDFA